MKFPFQKRPKKENPQVVKLGQPGSATWIYFEGERLTVQPGPCDLVVPMDRQWRPEGEPLPSYVEPIPDYVRPVNWQALQEAEQARLQAIPIQRVK